VQRGHRDLAGADQVEPVLLAAIRLLLAAGEEAGAEHRRVADQQRRVDRREAARDQQLDRVAQHRVVQQREVTEQDVVARAGHLGRAAEVEPALGLADLVVRARLEVEAPHLADPAHLVVLGVVLAVGHLVVGDVGHQRQLLGEPVAQQLLLLLQHLQLGLEGLLLLEEGLALLGAELAELLAARLLLAAHRVEPRRHRAQLCVDRERLVDRVGAVGHVFLDGPGLGGLRAFAQHLDVQHDAAECSRSARGRYFQTVPTLPKNLCLPFFTARPSFIPSAGSLTSSTIGPLL